MIEVKGELTEIGQFHDEPGHGIVIDTGRSEVFIGGLSEEDVMSVAHLLYQQVSIRIDVRPPGKIGSTPGGKGADETTAATEPVRRPSSAPSVETEGSHFPHADSCGLKNGGAKCTCGLL